MPCAVCLPCPWLENTILQRRARCFRKRTPPPSREDAYTFIGTEVRRPIPSVVFGIQHLVLPSLLIQMRACLWSAARAELCYGSRRLGGWWALRFFNERSPGMCLGAPSQPLGAVLWSLRHPCLNVALKSTWGFLAEGSMTPGAPPCPLNSEVSQVDDVVQFEVVE